VLVVLTVDLARSGNAVLEELKALEDNYRGQLVGGLLYLLAGDKNIYRMRPGPNVLKEHEPFNPANEDSYYEAILNVATKRVGALFGTRAEKRDLTVMVWQDLSLSPVEAKEKFEGFPDFTWHLFWTGPPSEVSTLAHLLEGTFRPLGPNGEPRFHRFEEPRGMAASFGRLLGAANR